VPAALSCHGRRPHQGDQGAAARPDAGDRHRGQGAEPAAPGRRGVDEEHLLHHRVGPGIPGVGQGHGPDDGRLQDARQTARLERLLRPLAGHDLMAVVDGTAAAAAAAPAARRWGGGLRPILLGCAPLVLVIVAWELTYRAGIYSAALLPSPGEVVAVF